MDDDLKLVSSVTDHDGSRNLEFSRSSCVPSPKFKTRKASCKRSFPMEFYQLAREINTKAKQESSVKLEEGVIYDHLMNKPSSPMRGPKSLPKRRKVSVVREFPDRFMQLNGKRDSHKKTTESENQKKDVALDSEDDIEPFEDNIDPFRSGAHIGFDLLSHNLEFDSEEPLVSADKEEILQLNGESIVPMSILKCEHGTIIDQNEGAEEHKLDNNDGIEDSLIGRFDGSEFEGLKLKNMVVDEAYVEVEDERLTLKEKEYSAMLPKRRKVSAVRDFPDAFIRFNEGNGELNASLVCIGGYQNSSAGKDSAFLSEDEEEPFENYPLPLTVLYDNGLDGQDSLFAYDETEPLEASYIDQSGIPEHEIAEQIGSEELEHRIIVQTIMAAPRDHGIQEHEITEVIDSSKDAQGQGSGTEFFQGQHLTSEELEGRVIVQALMAGTRCPWRSQTREGSKKRKCINS